MAQNSPSQILLTPVFRMYFPHLAEARAYQEKGKVKGEPNFSTQMILDPEALETFKVYDDEAEAFTDVDIRKVLVNLAKQEWPDEDVKAAIKSGGIFWPLKKGDQMAEQKGRDHEALSGKYVFPASTNEQYPPALRMKQDGKLVSLTRGLSADDTKIKNLFVGGSYAFAEINAKPLKTPQGRYLKAYLNAVCFVKPGERLGGGAGGLMDRFDGVEGGEGDYDPSESVDDLDDEIPF